MNESVNYMASSTVNWREQLRSNERRTHAVIALFILIYVLLGLFIDLYLHPQLLDLSVAQIFTALTTFQFIPIATLVLGAVAVISILVTYAFYDRIMLLGTEYHEINPEKSSNLPERQLYNVVEELKIAAGLRYMPKVYIIDADYMNAFASGYSEKSAMIAITRGLMNKLERSELQAVIAHELSHIRHHDIKLTLMATVLSNIMLIAIDIMFRGVLFSSIGGSRDKKRGDNNGILALVVILLRFLLPLITVLLALYLSRKREFMADSGSVELLRDNTPLAKALIKISGDHTANIEEYSKYYSQTQHEEVRSAAYIFDPKQMGVSANHSISSIFSTHPTLDQRLQALGFKAK